MAKPLYFFDGYVILLSEISVGGIIMKQSIDAFEYAGTVYAAMKKGILITAQLNGKVNPMTIGWGHIGIEWGRPIFVAYVRESRYTRELLDQTGEFTVNVPLEQSVPEILRICGTMSGRDVDKVALAGLTVIPAEKISAPGLKELPLTLECKVLYRQLQDLNSIPEDILSRYYPQNVAGSFSGSNRDAHYMYFGEILDAYIIR